MLKSIQFILIVVLFVSCDFKKEKIVPEGFELVWKNDSIRWNVTSIIENEGYLYGLTLDEELVKIDFKTGKVIWIRKTLPNYAFQEPLILDDKIFLGGRGAVLAFDLNGKLLWEKQTGEKIGHTLLYNDSLLFGSLRGSGIYAFNQKTGTVVWSIVSENQMLSTSDPALKDSLLLVGDFNYDTLSSSRLYCLNIDDRSFIWSYPTDNYLTSKAEVAAGKVFVNLDSDYEKGFTKALDLNTGKLLWQNKTYPDIFVKPTYIKGKLFVSSYKYGLFCLNPEDGRTIWKLPLDKAYPDAKFLLYNNTIVFGTWERKLFVVSLDGKIINSSDFNFGIGNPFAYSNELYVPTGGSELYRQVKKQNSPK